MLELPRARASKLVFRGCFQDNSLKNKKLASENGRVQCIGADVLGMCIETW